MPTVPLKKVYRALYLTYFVDYFGYALVFFGPIFGDLADHFGRKRAFLILNGGASLGYLISGLGIFFLNFPLLLDRWKLAYAFEIKHAARPEKGGQFLKELLGLDTSFFP